MINFDVSNCDCTHTYNPALQLLPFLLYAKLERHPMHQNPY
jgi:hypothetical protein